MADNTIFHKIARKEAPAYVIYEDDEFMAFLDIFPIYQGQTIIISKLESSSSKFSNADTELLKRTMEVGQKIAKRIEEKLEKVERCVSIIEGFDIDYLHLKLFPIKFSEIGKPLIGPAGKSAEKSDLIKLQKLLAI